MNDITTTLSQRRNVLNDQRKDADNTSRGTLSMMLSDFWWARFTLLIYTP